jgi:RNA polymerase sigma factor (sigma-70 family)
MRSNVATCVCLTVTLLPLNISIRSQPQPGCRPVSGNESDDAQFTEFYMRHRAKLVNTVWAWTGDRHLAEDVVQDAMLVIRRYWGRYEHPEILMYRIARQQLPKSPNPVPMQPQSTEGRHREAKRSTAAETGDDAILNLEDYLDLVRALQSIPTRQRECVILTELCDLDCVAVAEILGISESAVKTHKGRGLKRLETIMNDWTPSAKSATEQPVGGV